MSEFSVKEKQSFHMKKYLKEHIIDWIIGAVVDVVFVLLIVIVCDGTKYGYAVLLGVAHALAQAVKDIRDYKKTLPAEPTAEQ